MTGCETSSVSVPALDDFSKVCHVCVPVAAEAVAPGPPLLVSPYTIVRVCPPASVTPDTVIR